MTYIRSLFWLFFVGNLVYRGFQVLYLDTQPIFDFARYYQAAEDLADGKGFVMFDRTTAFQGVGYPGFLALFFNIFGPSILLGKMLNWTLGLLSALLLFHLTKRFLSERTAMLATLIYLYLPKEILYVNVLGSELLFNTLMLSFFAAYFQSWPKEGTRKHGQWLWLMGTGLILGVMSLVKPLSPVFGLIVFAGEIGRYLWPYLRGSKEISGAWWKAFLRTGIVAAVSIAVIAPWTYRNYLVFDAFVPLTTNGGYVLYVNNNPYATGAWMDPYEIPGSPIHQIQYPESDPRFEVEMNKLMKEAAQEWIAENPGRFSQLILYRFYETFYTNWDWKWAFEHEVPFVSKETREVVHRLTVVGHGILASPFYLGVIPVVLGALIFAATQNMKKDGIRELWERRLALILFSLPAVIITLVTMVFEGNARYSFPCHPVFSVYAAMVCAMWWRGMKEGSTEKAK